MDRTYRYDVTVNIPDLCQTFSPRAPGRISLGHLGALRRRRPAMTHVVALSGGKDSTAVALRLAEIEPREYVYLCTPTGDELPAMLAHWAQLEVLLGRPL